MNKSSGFAVGALAGIVMVLLTLLILQNREPAAYAQGGTVSGGDGLLMGTGGSQQNFTDIVWVLSKHPAPRRPNADPTDIVSAKDERITLCCYQVGMNARSIRLVATRDISFDIDVPELGNEKPTVRNIIDELRKAQPKEDNKK